MLESKFQKKVLAELKKIPNSYFCKKEAGSIRGIPDILGCVNSRAVALELKRDGDSLSESRCKLQAWTIRKINDAGGYACFVFPENLNFILCELKLMAQGFYEG
jgi:hypothetical protein